MLCYIFAAVAALGSILLVLGTQIHLLWVLPIFVGAFLAINILFLLGLLISTLFLPKKEPVEKLRNYYGIIHLVCDWITTILRIRVDFRGMEKFPDEPFVLVSNHPLCSFPTTFPTSTPSLYFPR